MIYTLSCERPVTGTKETYRYDSVRNVVMTADGAVVDFAQDERFRDNPRFNQHVSALAFSSRGEHFRQEHSQTYSESQTEPVNVYSLENPLKGKTRRVAKLRIQLGLACNYRCRYCLQVMDRQKALNMPKAADIQHFMEMLASSGVEMEDGGLIDLWGGEPLVYWPVLQVLIPMLRERFGFSVRLTIFTNGVLLTEAKSDFFCRYHVNVVISHDAQGFGLRHHEDPLNDPQIKARWLYLWEKGAEAGVVPAFFAVLNPLNCDLRAMRQFFDEAFFPGVRFEIGGTPSETESLPTDCLLTEANMETLRQSFLWAMTQPEYAWGGIRRRVYNLMGRFIHRKPTDGIRYHCNCVDEHVLCVTLAGDVISCQNRAAASHTIGRLENLEGVTNSFFRHWRTRRNCGDCLVLSSCKGGCPDLSEAAFERCCSNEWAFHYAVFCAAWYELTGTVIETVSPWPRFLKFRTMEIQPA